MTMLGVLVTDASSAALVTDASLVSDIDASLVIEASSAVPEPRGVFIRGYAAVNRRLATSRWSQSIACPSFAKSWCPSVTISQQRMRGRGKCGRSPRFLPANPPRYGNLQKFSPRAEAWPQVHPRGVVRGARAAAGL
jgi:hypothetical protein